MFVKTKVDQSKIGSSRRTFKHLAKDLCWAKLTRSMQSPYTKMDDVKENAKKMKKIKIEEIAKGKENEKNLASKEVREKKSKKKGWKRVRHAALATCRYIGLGAAHMSPVSMYSSPEYCVDPKYWNRSFSSSYKPKVEPKCPHWTSNMMFAGW